MGPIARSVALASVLALSPGAIAQAQVHSTLTPPVRTALLEILKSKL